MVREWSRCALFTVTQTRPLRILEQRAPHDVIAPGWGSSEEPALAQLRLRAIGLQKVLLSGETASLYNYPHSNGRVVRKPTLQDGGSYDRLSRVLRITIDLKQKTRGKKPRSCLDCDAVAVHAAAELIECPSHTDQNNVTPQPQESPAFPESFLCPSLCFHRLG